MIADKQQVLLDELLSMKDVTQEELVGILKDMGQTAEDDETLVGGIRGGGVPVHGLYIKVRKEKKSTMQQQMELGAERGAVGWMRR